MRYFVTPKFSEKVTSGGKRVLDLTASAMTRIEKSTKDEILQGAVSLEIEPNIYAIRHRDVRIILAFGADSDGEYALLIDLIVHSDAEATRPLAVRDPKMNMMIDPDRNMMIDPRRNMMIDPNRNMMIDPRRNMMIDVNRNMMIDPARNMGIDPKRNWQIGPLNNSTWTGPLLYDLRGELVGFLVRANDQISLVFSPSGDFQSSAIKAGEKNFNCFQRDGRWINFLVHNGGEGYNQFDLSGKWIGFIVGEIQHNEVQT